MYHPLVPYNYSLRFLLVGDTGVGKTALLHQFVHSTFPSNETQTIGVEFEVKTVQVKKDVIKLRVWDTAGDARFRGIIRSYYRGVQGAVIVYDITRRDSFLHVKDWLQDLKDSEQHFPHILLLANKADKHSLREVTTEEGQTLAVNYGLPLFAEVNAKNKIEVDKAFLKLVHAMYLTDSSCNVHTTLTLPPAAQAFKPPTIRKASNMCCYG